MKRVLLPMILAGLLGLASCGGAELSGATTLASAAASSTTSAPSPTTPPAMAEPVPFLVIAEIGGCFMMGPNCATTLVMSDGSFGVFRTDPADILAVPDDISMADITGHAEVGDLATTVANTDFALLRAQLDQGTCQACFDGIDVNVHFHTAQGVVALDSVTYDFDSGLELFQRLEALRLTINARGNLDLMQRGG